MGALMTIMTLAHCCAYLIFALPLPLSLKSHHSFQPWAQSLTFQLKLQGLVLAALVPARNSNHQKMILLSLLSAKRLNKCVCVLQILVCAACNACFYIFLPAAWLHSTVRYSRQHDTENNAGAYLSCRCLPMCFGMFLAGSVCYLFVQWLKEGQCCCCLHELSTGPAC